MNQKAMSAIQPRITPQKAMEIDRALKEAGKPFVDLMAKLYSLRLPAVRVYPDGRAEFADPYDRLPIELKQAVDDLREFKRQAERMVLRGYGIDPMEKS